MRKDEAFARPQHPPNPLQRGNSATHLLLIGLDAGSTSVKGVAVDPIAGRVLWSDYRRHEARPVEACLQLLTQLEGEFRNIPSQDWRVFATGSSVQTVAACIGAVTLHEVNALSRYAQRQGADNAATLIEIGGEDAKMVVFTEDGGTSGTPRRQVSMNDRCAGGTGVVIERISAKLGIARGELGALHYDGIRIHRVAGKCGVFAETDINGLHKQGVPPHELMASLFDAIVQQNLSVLARGLLLRPRVLLLGGAHAFIPGMRECWRFHLQRHWRERGVAFPEGSELASLIDTPEHALHFAALGAVEFGKEQLENDPGSGRYRGTAALTALIAKRQQDATPENATCRAASPEELARFRAAFKPNGWKPKLRSRGEQVNVYLGLDGGSTSTKAVLLDEDDEVVVKAYRLSQGDPVDDAKAVLASLDEQMRERGLRVNVSAAAVTGYAKDILKAAIGADLALVETVAHMRSASRFHPDADVICDVGGQDIKIILLGGGVVRDFRVNTQCSAGNGYYLQSTAEAFGYRVEDYAEAAFAAETMPVFDAGCAVFLQSEIVDAQRQGWRPHEILAGLAAVLPRNIWLNVCQMPNLPQLGRTFVLQGGVQRNLAAVKAQVDFIGQRFAGTGVTPQMHVHKHCGESGAIGCAIEAHREFANATRAATTSFIGFEAVARIAYSARRDETTRCGFCQNRCLRTFVDFAAHTRRYTVAPCEKGASEHLDDARDVERRLASARHDNPDLIEASLRLLFEPVAVENVAERPLTIFGMSRGRKRVSKRAGVRIGIPRVLNLYSTAPFFMGWFQSLGISAANIVWSDYTSERLYKEGAGWGSIDPCYPAKLAVAHVHNLLESKHSTESPLTHIFLPAIDALPGRFEETVAHRTCPASAAAPEAAHAAFMKVENLFEARGIRMKRTYLDLSDPEACAHQMYEDWAPDLGISARESLRAVREGFKALDTYHRTIRKQARAVLERLRAEGRVGILALCRPYHMDPGINHGILERLRDRGYPILTVDSLPSDADFLAPLFDHEAGEASSPMRIDDVWKNSFSENSSAKIWAAKLAARYPNLAVLELSSFKCGMDAPIAWTLERIFECSGTPFFRFRDLDENEPGASIAMRVDTIAYFLEQYGQRRSAAGHQSQLT